MSEMLCGVCRSSCRSSDPGRARSFVLDQRVTIRASRIKNNYLLNAENVELNKLWLQLFVVRLPISNYECVVLLTVCLRSEEKQYLQVWLGRYCARCVLQQTCFYVLWNIGHLQSLDQDYEEGV